MTINKTLRNLVILSLFMILACATKNSKTFTLYVSGFKVSCNTNNENQNSECYFVTKDLKEDMWNIAEIDTANFKLDSKSLNVVEVISICEQSNNMSPKYKVNQLIEKSSDPRMYLQKKWHLIAINNKSNDHNEYTQTLEFDLANQKIYGNGGCNTYNGLLSNVGIEKIQFESVIKTMKLCHNEASEDYYLATLNQVYKYKLENEKLHFYDQKGNKLMTFEQAIETSNKIRINDIWMAIRIMGNPINRMVTVPRLEINSNELKIFGNDGCNEYFGSIQVLTENDFSIENIGGTKMMCNQIEFSNNYITTLMKVKKYTLKEGKLILLDENNNELLAFIKTD